jgi:hypothetical protein
MTTPLPAIPPNNAPAWMLMRWADAAPHRERCQGRKQSNITATSSWTQQLQIWLTPYGFIRLANENKATVEAQNVVSFNVTRGNTTYRMRGHFNSENLLEKIETWLDDPIFGDMLVEAEFSAYRNFEGLRFPARILHKQGGIPTIAGELDGFQIVRADGRRRSFQ